MTSPFFGLDIASRALQAQQTMINVTNQNIANANTPGYSRQSATLAPTMPYPIPVFQQSGQAGQMGTGVQVTDISRARDAFVDYQYRNQVSSQANWDAQTTAMSQIEAVVNEPTTTGLSSLLTTYWQSWQEVANSPADVSVRSNLLEQGKALAQSFQSIVQQYQTQQQDVDMQIKLSVDDINNYVTQIAHLNGQISGIVATGMKANDLTDQRDQLVDKLSALIKVTTVDNPDGSQSLYVGGHQLVDRAAAHTVGLDQTGQFARVIWNDQPGTPPTSAPSVAITDGKLYGLEFMRDGVPPTGAPSGAADLTTTDGIQGRINAINALASRIIQQVNAVHSAGVGIDGTGGLNFFIGHDATDMAVDPTLTAGHIAAARSSGTSSPSHATGDSSNAVAIAQLQNAVSQSSLGAGSLSTGKTVGGATILGLDVSEAAVNAPFTVSVTPGTPPALPMVTISDGVHPPRTAQWVVSSDTSDNVTPGNDIYTLDTGTTGINDATLGMGLGVRLTLSVPHGTDPNTAFAGLDSQTFSTRGPTTVGDQYSQEIASIGVKSSTAKSQSTNKQTMMTQLTTQRQQVSGVSLDEEATNLIQYQHAYEAAARVISVMDSLLDTLINHTGVA
jgi:flagellar hook-associated protein 1 FlgK